MTNLTTQASLTLPFWVKPFLDQWTAPLNSSQERLRLAIALARENVEQKTGGPFASVIVETASSALVSVGVNVVVPGHTSLAHGEIVALLMAQQAWGTHDLAEVGRPALTLATNAQPCVQCYGAILWSGVKHVLQGARGSDVEALTGFDEGPLPRDWEGEWLKRGITLEKDILRDEACEVLSRYRSSGAPIYNPGRS